MTVHGAVHIWWLLSLAVKRPGWDRVGHLLLCMHGRLRKHYFHFLVGWFLAGKAAWPQSSHMTISGGSRTLLLEGSKVAGRV